MLNKHLKSKLQRDVSAITAELKRRGFSKKDIQGFISDCTLTECQAVLSTITAKEFKFDQSQKFRLTLIIGMCSVRDRRRVLYSLNKRNVRSLDQLNELAGVFRDKFENRCPKVINSELKKKGNKALLNRIAAENKLEA